jgi:hypothetical protein
MSKDRINLLGCITGFAVALIYLKQQSKLLDRQVMKEMKKCKHIDELQTLVVMLPKEYRGARRVYEKMLRLEGKEQTKRIKEMS